MLYKCKVTDRGHVFYFITSQQDVSDKAGTYARHCSQCCSKILTDITVFSHHLANAEVKEYEPKSKATASLEANQGAFSLTK